MLKKFSLVVSFVAALGLAIASSAPAAAKEASGPFTSINQAGA